jgi:hypothetical protein
VKPGARAATGGMGWMGIMESASRSMEKKYLTGLRIFD